MRIEGITIQNFLGVQDFRHALTSPVLFVAGPNGAGKSSLQDAVRFALIGEAPRGVTKVADRPHLITDGAAAGYAQVVIDGFEVRRNIGSGKLVGDTPQIPEATALCLDAPRFAGMSEADRRRWLFALAQVQIKREAIAEQLIAAGIDESIVERVIPLLREGFPAAAAFAKEKAAEARGAWKAITGEVYGTQKGAVWQAKPPETPTTLEELEQARALVEAAEAKAQVATEARGRVSSAMSAEKRAELEELAGRIEALEAAFKNAEAAVDEAAREQSALLAGNHSEGEPHTCPACEAKLLLVGGELKPAPRTKPPSQAAINGAAQKVGAAKRDRDAAYAALRAAEGAQATLDNLPEGPSQEDVAAAANYGTAQDDLRLHRAALRALEDAWHLAEAAEGKTERATAEHRKVKAWMDAEAQLGPDGIPATLLSKALDPINDALAQQAQAAGFRPARVERDLSLTYAGRPYALCSESERWRADALFAVVVAVFSDVRIVALDRFDVLDPPSRGDVIDWLAALGAERIIDTAIVTGTLKTKPDLGDGCDVVWLETATPMQAAA